MVALNFWAGDLGLLDGADTEALLTTVLLVNLFLTGIMVETVDPASESSSVSVFHELDESSQSEPRLLAIFSLSSAVGGRSLNLNTGRSSLSTGPRAALHTIAEKAICLGVKYKSLAIVQ